MSTLLRPFALLFRRQPGTVKGARKVGVGGGGESERNEVTGGSEEEGPTHQRCEEVAETPGAQQLMPESAAQRQLTEGTPNTGMYV